MVPLRCIQILTTEILKYPHIHIYRTIFGEAFKVNKSVTYDLRMRNELYARNTKTGSYGVENISFSYPKIRP